MTLLRRIVYSISTVIIFLLGCGGGGGGSSAPVIQAPTALVYSTNPATYTVGTIITANTPGASGGTAVSYGVSPGLPAGLTLNTTSGAITGTPTAAVAQATYTVTATNSAGSANCSLVMTVNAAVVAPSNLTYSTNPATYAVGTAISTNNPTASGSAITSYGVTPSLPVGLTLNTTSGAITGIPTAAVAQATYTVTAINSAGRAECALVIAINSTSRTSGTFRIRTGALGAAAGSVVMGLQAPTVMPASTLRFEVGIPATEGGTFTVSNTNTANIQYVALTTLASDGQTLLGKDGVSETFLATDPAVLNIHSGFTSGSLDLAEMGMSAPGPSVFMARFGAGATMDITAQLRAQSTPVTSVNEMVLRLGNPEYSLKDSGSGKANVVTGPHFIDSSTGTLYSPLTTTPDRTVLHTENLTANGQDYAFLGMGYIFFVPASKIGQGQSCYVFGGSNASGEVDYTKLGMYDPTGLSVSEWILRSPGLAKALDQFAGSDRTTTRWTNLATYFKGYVEKFMGTEPPIHFSPTSRSLGTKGYASPFEIIALDDTNGLLSLDGNATLNLKVDLNATGLTYTLDGGKLNVAGTPPLRFMTTVTNGTATAQAPAITTQPGNQTIISGQSANFQVVANGTPTPSFQWQKSTDGTTWSNLTTGTGFTTSSYGTPATTSSDTNSSYRVVVTNTAGSTTSQAATLTVTAASPLSVSLAASRVLSVTEDGSFTPTVSGGVPPYTYAWQKNGTTVTQAVLSNLALSSLRLADQGTYQVQVTDAAGQSRPAPSKLFVKTTRKLPAGLIPDGLLVSAGDLYLTSAASNQVLIYRSTSGTPTVISISGGPTGVAADVDGNAWVTVASGGLARIDKSTRAVTSISVAGNPYAIAQAPDGSLWFTVRGTDKVGHLTSSSSTPTLYDLTPKADPRGISVASDGTVWFTEPGLHQVGCLQPGTKTPKEWKCPDPLGQPESIVADSNGVVTYTDGHASTVVHFNLSQQGASGTALIKPFSVEIDPFGGPAGLALGSQGERWVTQRQVGKVSRLYLPTQLSASSVSGPLERTSTLLASSDGASSGATTYTLPSGTSQPTDVSVGNNGEVYAILPGTSEVAQVPTTASSIQVAIQAQGPLRMLKGAFQTFTATVTGATDTSVTWEVVEGSTGGVVTSGGGYTAPSTAGTYTLLARSVADPAQFGRLQIQVFPWSAWPLGQTAVLAGDINGIGNIDGQGSASRFNRPEGVAVDSSGNIYVSDAFNQSIRKISSAGIVSNLAGAPDQEGTTDGLGSAARFHNPSPMAVDSTGNVYLGDVWTLRKISPNGAVTTLAGSPTDFGDTDGVGSAARFRDLKGLALDGSENIYVADWIRHTIRKITPDGTVSTVAGVAGQAGYLDGAAATAKFDAPYGVALDVAGNLYVTDLNNAVLRKISTSGTVSTLAGTQGIKANLDGTGSAARFSSPMGITVNTSSGHFYISDNDFIREITPDGLVTTLAGGGPSRADGTGNAAGFHLPEGIAVSPDGSIYVADNLNFTVRKVSPNGAVSTVAGLASDFGLVNGPAAQARFFEPMGVAADASGQVFVADTSNSVIRKIATDGAVTTVAGPVVDNTAPLNSAARSFSKPQGIAVDSAGSLYVADTANHCIRKITSGTVTVLAGLPGQSGADDGTGTQARFNAPQSLTVDASGNVYVADTENALIRKITSAGVVTTLAGILNTYGAQDGAGTSATFGRPNGIVMDASGNLFVTDYWMPCIRKISTTGTVSTLVGQPWTASPIDGEPDRAGFSRLSGLAVDSSGNLFLADLGSNALRMVTRDGFVGTLVGDINAGINRAGGLRDGSGLPLPSNQGALAAPRGVAVGPDGSLFVVTSNGVMKVTFITPLSSL